jgi:hypothetical protein
MAKKPKSEDDSWARDFDEEEPDDDGDGRDSGGVKPAAAGGASAAQAAAAADKAAVQQSMSRVKALQALVSKCIGVCTPAAAGKRVLEGQVKLDLLDVLSSLDTELNFATKVRCRFGNGLFQCVDCMLVVIETGHSSCLYVRTPHRLNFCVPPRHISSHPVYRKAF